MIHGATFLLDREIALWSQVVSSVLFFFAVIYLFVRFVLPAIARQQEAKNAEIADNERRRDRATELAAQAERELTEADVAAASILERGARDALHERERIVAEATAEGERVVRNAQAELGRARYAARDRLRAELIERALDVARQTAASRIDGETDRTLIDGVLAAIDPSVPKARA